MNRKFTTIIQDLTRSRMITGIQFQYRGQPELGFNDSTYNFDPPASYLLAPQQVTVEPDAIETLHSRDGLSQYPVLRTRSSRKTRECLCRAEAHARQATAQL
nr:hypothetical protein CFP56_63029 [Quercus suber]